MLRVFLENLRPGLLIELRDAIADVLLGDAAALAVDFQREAAEEAAELELQRTGQGGDEEAEAVKGDAQENGEDRIQRKSLAIPKAAAAARLPTRAVCRAERTGLPEVTRPFA